MPLAEIKSKQAVYTLGLLHAELPGKLLANIRRYFAPALPFCDGAGFFCAQNA
jgi:hypothetical protein